MLMYNLLEYSPNILWNKEVYVHEIDDFDDNASDGEWFKYKTKKVRKTIERSQKSRNQDNTDWPAQPAVPTFNVEVTIPLKYLRNFWRFFNLSLIKCEIQLHLSWTRDQGFVKQFLGISNNTTPKQEFF